MIVPSRRFWWLVGAGLVPALLGSVAPGLEQVLWPYNLILLGLLLIDARRAGRATDLEVGRTHDPVLSVRAPNMIRLRVVNIGRSRLRGRLREDPPQSKEVSHPETAFDLAPGGATTFEYRVCPTERGADFFGPTLIRLEGP